MPSTSQIVQDAIRLFREAKYPDGFSLRSAWLGVYQTLLWYEEVGILGYDALPRITDANQLRPPAGKAAWKKPHAWQKRAEAFEKHLADALGCSVDEVAEQVDLLMRLPDYKGSQRNNYLGIGLTAIVRYILETCGRPGIEYEVEADPYHYFAGIGQFAGRGKLTAIDLLAISAGIPVAIISTKWTVRHDRIHDLVNECPVYRNAYRSIYGRSPAKLAFYVLTTEFQPSRLERMLNEPCIDGVVHVYPAALDVVGVDNVRQRLMGIPELVEAAKSW